MILFKNTNYKLDLAVIDRTGDFATGLTVTYEIRKSSDNSLIASGTMLEVGSTGIYQTSTISISNLGKYRIEYTTPVSYENVIEEFLIIDSVWDETLADHLTPGSTGKALDDADAVADPSAVANAVWNELTFGSGSSTFGELMKRIAGLCQENYRIFNPVYITKNRQQCMTSATIKVYPTATDCESDTNSLAEYQITATFANDATMTGYKVKKV